MSEFLSFHDSAVEHDYFGLVWYLVVDQPLLELINAVTFRLQTELLKVYDDYREAIASICFHEVLAKLIDGLIDRNCRSQSALQIERFESELDGQFVDDVSSDEHDPV